MKKKAKKQQQLLEIQMQQIEEIAEQVPSPDDTDDLVDMHGSPLKQAPLIPGLFISCRESFVLSFYYNRNVFLPG